MAKPEKGKKMGCSKVAKPVRCKKNVSVQSAVNSPAPERARYVVPGDDVEDADLVFSAVDWPLCERSRYLDPQLSERTRILAAVFGRMQVPPAVGLAAWAQSGLFSDDPNVVLDRLPGNDNKKKRQSMRLLPAMTRQTIKDMADDSEISDDDFFISTQPMIHDVVKYAVTESQANANAKAAGAAFRSSSAVTHDSGRRKSKTDFSRRGTFSEPEDYNAVIEESRRQEEQEALDLPWRCQVPVGKVVARRQPCGHKLKSERGCTQHAITVHNGFCFFKHAVSKIERKEQISLADFAADSAVSAAPAAVVVPAAAAAAAPAAVVVPAAAAAAPAAVASSRRKRCSICKRLYLPGTYIKHTENKLHREAMRNIPALLEDEYDV